MACPGWWRSYKYLWLMLPKLLLTAGATTCVTLAGEWGRSLFLPQVYE